MSRIYDLTLGAGGTGLVPARGSFAKLIAAQYGATIRLDTGEAFALQEGQGVRLEEGKSFGELLVTNTSSVAQLVQVFVGDSRFEDSRITGVVSVVDTAKQTTTAAQAFGGIFGVSASAGNYSHVSIANPAGSGKRTVIERLVLGASTANAGTNPVDVGFLAGTLGTSQGPFSNKLAAIGGLPLSATLRYAGTQGSMPGPLVYPAVPLASYYIAPGASTPDFVPKRPLVLMPGFSLLALSSVSSMALNMQADFYEEAL